MGLGIIYFKICKMFTSMSLKNYPWNMLKKSQDIYKKCLTMVLEKILFPVYSQELVLKNLAPNIFSGIGFEESCSQYILRNWLWRILLPIYSQELVMKNLALNIFSGIVSEESCSQYVLRNWLWRILFPIYSRELVLKNLVPNIF